MSRCTSRSVCADTRLYTVMPMRADERVEGIAIEPAADRLLVKQACLDDRPAGPGVRLPEIDALDVTAPEPQPREEAVER